MPVIIQVIDENVGVDPKVIKGMRDQLVQIQEPITPEQITLDTKIALHRKE